MPSSSQIWTEYFRFEVNCVVKLATATSKNSCDDVKEGGENETKKNPEGDLAPQWAELDNSEPNEVDFQEINSLTAKDGDSDDSVIGIQHLTVILNTATQRLQGSADLGTFLISVLNVLPALLQAPQSRISGVRDFATLLTTKLVEAKSSLPLIVFLLWKLEFLDLVSKKNSARNRNQFTIQESLSRLLSVMEATWTQGNDNAGATTPLKTSNPHITIESQKGKQMEESKLRTESLTKSLLVSPVLTAQEKTKETLMLSLISLLFNLSTGNPKASVDADFVLDPSGTESGLISKNRLAEIDRQRGKSEKNASIMPSIFASHSPYERYLENHRLLALSSFVLPAKNASNVESAKQLSQERSIVWDNLTIKSAADQESECDNEFCLSVEGSDDAKREEICKWVVTVMLSEILSDNCEESVMIGVVPVVVEFIKSVMSRFPAKRQSLMLTVLNKLRSTRIPQSKEAQLERQVLLDQLELQVCEGGSSETFEGCRELMSLGVSKATQALLKSMFYDKNALVKWSSLVAVTNNCSCALIRMLTRLTKPMKEVESEGGGTTEACFENGVDGERRKTKRRKLTRRSNQEGASPDGKTARAEHVTDGPRIPTDSNSAPERSPSFHCDAAAHVVCLPLSVIEKLHQQFSPVYDLLYGACPENKLVEFVQRMLDKLTPIVRTPTQDIQLGVSSDADVTLLSSLRAMEWLRIMNTSFCPSLNSVER